MDNIPISLIKKLREYTNISILECKKALIESNGNIQLAIDHLRKNGIVESIKKMRKITKEGIILTQITKNKKYGIMVEINCETDFVSKNSKFIKFCYEVANAALNNKITDIHTLQNEFNEKKNMLTTIFDENINIRRITYIKGTTIGHYLHNKKIGVIVSSYNSNINEKLLQYIAMHITANKPKYIDVQHIPINIINHEKDIQMSIALKSGKPYEIAQKITEGRVNKFINEISLMNQPFVMDTKKTVKNFLYENNIKISNFFRFEIGENI